MRDRSGGGATDRVRWRRAGAAPAADGRRAVAAACQGSYKEREAIIRFSGREAVELAIYKEGDANTVAAADAVRKACATSRRRQAARQRQARADRCRRLRHRRHPVQTIEDQSQVHPATRCRDVKFDALIGGLLSILIIFLFLRDGWSTFVIGLSLPVSIIATFFFMDQLGLSLNVMSLGGLALATGLVVDDSIVVLESIAKARERGLGILAGGDRRHPRSQHGGRRVDADHGRGVPAAGVRARASPASCSGPGADGLDRAC